MDARKEHDQGKWGFFAEDTPYNRQKLSAFTGATGIKYKTFKMTDKNELVVVFCERVIEKLQGE